MKTTYFSLLFQPYSWSYRFHLHLLQLHVLLHHCIRVQHQDPSHPLTQMLPPSSLSIWSLIYHPLEVCIRQFQLLKGCLSNRLRKDPSFQIVNKFYLPILRWNHHHTQHHDFRQGFYLHKLGLVSQMWKSWQDLILCWWQKDNSHQMRPSAFKSHD